MAPFRSVPNATLCRIPDCDGQALGNDLCSAHEKRKVRGQVVDDGLAIKRRDSDRGRILSTAAINYANASAEDDAAFERAWESLRYAAKAFVLRADEFRRLGKGGGMVRLRIPHSSTHPEEFNQQGASESAAGQER